VQTTQSSGPSNIFQYLGHFKKSLMMTMMMK